MTTSRRLTDAERAALVADIDATAGREDGSVRDIAARHEVSLSTVHRAAELNGLGDRWAAGAAQTAAATERRVLDSAQRRAQLADQLLDDVDRLRAQMFAPTVIGSFGGRDNVWAETELEQPPIAGQRDLVTAVGTLVGRHLDLTRYAEEKVGTDAAGGLLERLVAGLEAGQTSG